MQIKNEQMEKKQKEERGKKNLNDQNIQNEGTWEGNIPRNLEMHMDCSRSKVRNRIWGNGKDRWQMMPQKLYGFWVNLTDFLW
jgi:hypothetical protein